MGTPLLDYFNLKLEYELRKINEYENISNVLINIGGRIGNLMDITQEAIGPSGQKDLILARKKSKKYLKLLVKLMKK